MAGIYMPALDSLDLGIAGYECVMDQHPDTPTVAWLQPSDDYNAVLNIPQRLANSLSKHKPAFAGRQAGIFNFTTRLDLSNC